MFKPLTTGSGENTHGAKTIVTQTLKFKGSSAGNKTPLTGKDLLKEECSIKPMNA